MANHHLLENLYRLATEEAERVFGGECTLDPPDPALKLAPVKRVAIFAEAFLPKVDGVSKTAYITLRHLQQTGREVLVFAPDIAPHAIGETRVIPLPSLGMPSVPETRLALPHPMVAQALAEFKPDLIHLFSPAVVSVSGMIVGRQLGVPVVANYQTDLPGYTEYYGYSLFRHVVRDWLRFIHNGCHLTLVPSNWTLRELRAAGYHRMRRWGRGVNRQRFNPGRRTDAMRARLLGGRPADSLLCLYVGRLAHEKRVDLLLDVARLPGVALTIIGDGGQRSELEALFAGTGTVFTGYLYGDELAEAYASADAFFFPGDRETFGQVVQEALASGLPAVIINQGGITDLVTSGVNGYVCPPDRRAFAAAARRLRDDPDLRRRMSTAAAQSPHLQPWEALMAQLETYYAEAAALNARARRIYPHGPGLLSLIFNRGAAPIGTNYDRVS